MSNSLIPSFLMSNVSESLRSLTKMSDVSKLLRLLTKNERPWAICSGRSPKMSNHEQIAQVAHEKWANEQIAHFFEQIAHSLIFSKKRAIRSENRWANSQPCLFGIVIPRPSYYYSIKKPCFCCFHALKYLLFSEQYMDARLASLRG